MGATERRAAPTAAAATVDPLEGRHSFGVERGRPGLVALELVQAGAGLVEVTEHVSKGLAVLPAKVVQELAPRLHRGQTLRVVLDALPQQPQLVARIGHVGRRRSQPGFDGLERPPAGNGRDGHPQRVDRSAVAVQRDARGRRRLAMGEGAGEFVFLEGQALVLVGIAELRPLELVHLEAQQVDLAGAGSFVAAELGQRDVDAGDSSARLAERREIHRTETVECGPLRRNREQRLVRVLSV